MFTPKYPPHDTPPIPPTPSTYSPAPHIPDRTSVRPAPATSHPTVQLTPGSMLTLAAGGGALVLVVGAVLVSMLLAVTVTAASVAVCAVTVRSILRSDRR
ncbi:hypothetical protein GCM10010385_02900 [Streptomyces geysiriensis]|uniref:hypothetical protein n=1 Tax=Streptomyces TaxID=1883 RepID=UPI0004C9041A|nr:hypothetical protein [Streptomyces sp. WAC06128]RSS70442.1 SpdD protein [Streptomyces sp. WAC06128]GGY57417.1 hypothetical protein GCM10010385_02900 [Streptomyces geysiriensis]